MKIAILGMGGIGGYYGVKLAQEYVSGNQHQVFFIARGDHLQQIQRQGLKLIAPTETIVAAPTAATDAPQSLGPLDLILVCTKGYDLEAAARLVAHNLHSGTVVVPLGNGVDNAERLRTVLPQGTVFNGCVYISSRIAQPGVVEQVGGTGKMLFGPENGPAESYRELEDLLRSAGIDAVLSANIAQDVWSKYLFICSLAGITSMLEQPFGAILENPEHHAMLEGLMAEIKTVAEARGFALPPDVIAKSLQTAANFPYDTKSSMQLDYENGKKTELETFTGYVVKSGRELGIATPLNDRVYAALKDK